MLGLTGQAIYTVNPSQIEKDLRTAFPDLAGVNVQIGIPNHLRVNIVERTPVLAWYQDGSTFWSGNTYSVIRDPEGQPLAILGSGHDINESKKAQIALESSEKRFRALIEHNTDAIVLVDPRGRVLFDFAGL